jgi:3-oxoacyl-[acyl-carrier protein] reductase
MLCIDLSDKKALITGSTRGIGRAIAEYLAKAGAFVVITGRDEERAQQVAKSISDKAIGVAMDLSDPDSIRSAYERIEKEVGPVDILVNNAGITKDKLFIRMSLEDWEEVMRVNLTGTFLLTSLVVKGMLKKRWGRIINISSVVGFMGNVGQVNYSTTKSALLGFTKSLAKELASRNITVNAIAPGFIETDMTAKALYTPWSYRNARVYARGHSGNCEGYDPQAFGRYWHPNNLGKHLPPLPPPRA